jgi:outer membrane biosynthesis protein TonB
MTISNDMEQQSSDRKKEKKAKRKRKRQKYYDEKTDRKKKEKIPDATTKHEPEATPTSIEPQVAVTVPLATNLGGTDENEIAATASSGWSWGQAFNAAAHIRPNDDLDEDFLRRTSTAAAAPDGDGDDHNQRGGGGGLSAIAGMIGNACTPSSRGEISEPAGAESTRASASSIDTEPTTPVVEEGEAETTHESKKEKKKKKKKSKKKDKKKLKKKSNDDSNIDDKSKKRKRFDDSSSTNEDDPDLISISASAGLEGRMIPIDPADPSSELLMVLADATSGAVFSGMDRTQSGDRIQIGKLVNGQVVLDPTSKGNSNGEVIYFTFFFEWFLTFIEQRHSYIYACIEADALAS